MTKKIYVDGFVHLQKASITASSENVPDAQSSACKQKYYHLFEQNVLIKSACILKKYTVLKLIFGEYLEPRKELTKFA